MGRNGVQIGRVLGVPVYLTTSWFLFAAFITFAAGGARVPEVGATRAYAAGASIALLLGLSVLLHEIGHCVVARAFDLPVKSITITLLAGLTEITKPPQTPAREYAVAVAGPTVSLLLAGIGVALVPAFDGLPQDVCAGIAITNGIVAAFNLLPGLPLDGGRVLRAAVWRLSGDEHGSVRWAARAGQVVAVVVVPLLLLGLLPELGYGGTGLGSVLFSALISAYIYAGATATLRQNELVRKLPQVSVAALARPAVVVPADLPVSLAVQQANDADARGIVVTDSSGRPTGVVNEAALIATPEQRRPWVQVGALARSLDEGLVLDADLAGERLLDALRRTPASEYLVQDPDGVRVLSASDVVARMKA